MKLLLLNINIIILGLLFNLFAHSQEKLFSIDDTDYYTNDFLETFKIHQNKTTNDINDVSLEDFNQYLIYCLKIHDGKQKKVYESKNFIRKFNRSKKAIIKNYIGKNNITTEEIEKYYNRSLLLIDYQELAISPVNEITRKKIMELKDRLNMGEDFIQLISKYGNPSLRRKKGIKTNFKCFQGDPSFEEVLFDLAEGEISSPIKTSKSYHIIKLLKIKPNPGKVRIQQIYIKNRKNPAIAKQIIDSIYNVLITSDITFGKLASIVSEDTKTKKYGGILPWFGIGDYIPAIENIAFKLPKEKISEVIKIPQGWVIIQLIDFKADYYNKNEIRHKLTENYLNDIEKQKAQINFKEYKDFSPNSIINYTNKDFDKKLFNLNGKDFTIGDYHQFNLNNRFRGSLNSYNKFVKEALYQHFIQSIIDKVPSLKKRIDDAYENHIFFYVQENKIWKKTIFESVNYFNRNKAEYQKKYGNNITFKNIIKEVRDDYSKAINKEWISELKNNYKVNIFNNKFKNNNPLFND